MNNTVQISKAGARYFAEQHKRAQIRQMGERKTSGRNWTERAPILHFSGIELPPVLRPVAWYRREATLLDAIVLAGSLSVILMMLWGWPA